MSAVYLWACAFARRRHLTIKGQRLVLPSWRFALLQMALSVANWMVMGAIIWLLMAQQVDYFLVLGVLLVSSIAGVIVHIPAGIGVLEAVLSPCFPPSRLAAGDYCRPAGLARAVLLLPLLIATVGYLLLESRAKTLREKNQRKLADG